MDIEAGPQIGVSPPKLLFIPIRPLIFFLTGFNIFVWVAEFIEGPDVVDGIYYSLLVFGDVLLFVGAYKYNEKYLRWSLKIILIYLVIQILELFVLPIMVASYVASGVYPRHFIDFSAVLVDMFHRDNGTKDEMYMNGLKAGYWMEFILISSIGVEALVYVSVNRLWEYVKSSQGF